jgi:hypothetical protein
MNTTSQITGVFRSTLDRPPQDVVGLVNDLLSLCHEQRLQLDWQADWCRIRTRGGGSEEVIDNPLRKSVFRAILARLAVLCNERSDNFVSPYGGQGKLSVGDNPATLFQVSFANTSDDQWLQLTPLAVSSHP